MPNNITAEEIIYINKSIGYSPLNSSLVESSLSSVNYYDDVKHQISSIVRSLVKNHAFRDGNKRTAALVYVMLCEDNRLKIKSDKMIFDAMIIIASKNYSVEQVTKLLF